MRRPTFCPTFWLKTRKGVDCMNKKRSWIYIGVAVLGIGGAEAQAADMEPYWGTWQVRDVMAPAKGKRIPVDKGTLLEFSATGITNPLGQDCSKPNYSRLKRIHSKAFL